MKRFEVSTEIGSLSVTYQKQKKVLVCLNGAGLLPSYENFSLILEKPPPTIGYLTIDFPNTGRSPIHDQAGKNLDNLADAVYEVLEELGISEYILCANTVLRNVTDIKLWGIWFLFILLAIGMNWLTYSCFKKMFRLRQELGKSKGGRH
ncbi:alpha/beta fold hydrolase [Streptococcus pneumoniae]|uniref:alpha/beta fold hydrolase n=1 Tax=Streptococcus pneumoniae TaxID=1313 RepID=UPI00061BBEB3|nr:alpha/beta hydrolase [Streptococcus pneumoniae]COM32386.1 alpha/beta fold family hydrolase [Streptococcus pneumoniae]